MSLRHRLIALILLILPLSLIAGGVLSYAYARHIVAKEMSGAVELGRATVAEVMSSVPPPFDSAPHVARIIRSFDGDRDIIVSHVNAAGSVVDRSRAPPIANPPPDWLMRALSGLSQSAEVAVPGEGMGVVRIDPAPQNEIAEVWEEMTLQFVVMAAFFTLILWLVSWTLSRALRPLDNLAMALSEVGQGNFAAHVDETGPQELVAIYREFNRMAQGLKHAETRNLALTQQLNAVQEEERKDLARDLHDEIGPFLFAVDVDAQTIAPYLERGANDEAVARAGAIRQSVAHMQRHLRSILNRLRPAMLLDLGLAQAVDQLIAFWRRRHPAVEITADISQASYGDGLDEIAFRTIQEALANAIRHGKPDRVMIKAARDATGTKLEISIVDDGSGISPASAAGFGIAGMRERAAAAGGSVEIIEKPDQRGVAVLATLPLASNTVSDTPPQAKGVTP